MKHGWRPELYTEADVDELVKLCQAQPGKAAAITPEYVHWQHRANPAGLAQVGLAKENGSDQIVGVLWLIPLWVQIGEDVVLGSQSIYALVHPDYRRQGVFMTLVGYCDQHGRAQGYQFSFGFPNPSSYPGFIHRLGWDDLGQARLFVRPLNANRLITRRLGAGLIQEALATAGQTWGCRLFRPRPLGSRAAGIEVEEADTTDAALDGFWKRIRTKYPVMVVRDTRFLDWRYTQVPGRTYHVWAARQEGQIVATIAVRSTTIEAIACGMVVDFLVEPTERGRLAGEVLLHEAAGHFQEQDLDLAGCLMLPHAEEIKLLRRQGYILCPRWLQPQPFPVILLVHDGAARTKNLQDFGSWFLTMGDFDAV